MIPYITKGDLIRLPEKRRKKICGCQTMCKSFVTIATENEDFILCANMAKQFVFEIMEKLGLEVEDKLVFTQSKRGWTTMQEQFIIKYFKDEDCYHHNGRVKDGVFAFLGEMLGKSRQQVRDKIYSFKRTGKL